MCEFESRQGHTLYMDEEILVSAGAVFKNRAGKNLWLLVKGSSNESWQLPKSIVRRNESSVRAVIRTLSEMAGVRVRVIDEVSKTSVRSGRNGRSFTKRTIYYLMQQRGKDGTIATSRTTWVNARNMRGKLKSIAERKILTQAKKILTQWQKENPRNH